MGVTSVDKDLDSLTLTLVAHFDAPLERVWQLWADARQLERWWGPPGYPATVEEHDLTTGGSVTYFMTGPDGDQSRGWWRVTSVDPPTALEFTDGFADADGTPSTELPTTTGQVRLTEDGGRTRMELRSTFASREQMEEMLRMGMAEGIEASVGQMDAVLAGGSTTSSTVLYMSMSLDGFIAGPNVSSDNGLGDGGERLHEWALPGGEDGHHAAAERLQGANRQVFDEFMSTGAVVAGRQTFEPAGGWGGDHHDGVPVYILSRNPPPAWAARWPAVHYVSDLEAAVRDAKHAAGGRNVLVHGASIAQRALVAGLLDELEVHVVPVLMGDGRRLFEHLGVGHRELERIRVLEGEGGVTHLRYRVHR